MTVPFSPRALAKSLSATMRCNCDLDDWEPTGHSSVCRIHNAAFLLKTKMTAFDLGICDCAQDGLPEGYICGAVMCPRTGRANETVRNLFARVTTS